jgi:hypothetical protein
MRMALLEPAVMTCLPLGVYARTVGPGVSATLVFFDGGCWGRTCWPGARPDCVGAHAGIIDCCMLIRSMLVMDVGEDKDRTR